MRGFSLQKTPSADIELKTAQHKVLTIDQIMPYDRNPRRTVNPRFDEIKDAIRAAGKLNNLLTVTRRPGESHYMVESGGNTRLDILKELWQETHLETFYKTDCLIVPWQSDNHVLCAHLIENELRGDMTLIDKAVALRNLKIQLENESGQVLSRNEFCKRLKQMGYPTSRRQLIRFEYAADFLEPLIPMALAAGLGGYSIEKLRKIEAGYSKCLTEFGSTQHFEPMFAQALINNDGEAIDIDSLQRTLDNFIANSTGQPLNRVRLQVDALMLETLDGEESEFTELTNIAENNIGNAEIVYPSRSNSVIAPFLNPDSTLADTHQSAATPSPDLLSLSGQAQKEPSGDNDVQPTNPANPGDGIVAKMDVTHVVTLEPTTKTSLKLSDLLPLRRRCCELAQQLSTEIPLPLPIKTWCQGYGFYLDIPDQPIQDEIVYLLFWLMVGLSGQQLSSERIKLAQEMKFAQLLLEGQELSAYGIVGTPAPLTSLGHGVLLSKKLPDTALETLFKLIQVCRQIRFAFRESDIFECITIEQIQLRDQITKLTRPQSTANGEDDE